MNSCRAHLANKCLAIVWNFIIQQIKQMDYEDNAFAGSFQCKKAEIKMEIPVMCDNIFKVLKIIILFN